VISFVLALIYLILLRCCASVVIFFTLVSIFILFGGFGFWLYNERDRYPEDTRYYNAMLYGAYTLWGLDALYVLILLCLCNRIRLGVAVIKATAQFIGNTPQVFIVPIVFFFLCMIWVAAWCFSFVYLFSMGTIEPRDDPLSFLTAIKWDKQTRYLCLYDIFGFLWVNAFLIGSC
jgi:hypothetical protein